MFAVSARSVSSPLTTSRLRLRQWRYSDLAPLAQLNANPQAMRYFPKPLTHAESDALAERCRTQIAQQGWGLWAVETRHDRDFIGLIGLQRPNPKLGLPAESIEICWRLMPEHWGRGYGAEGARAALDYGFLQLHLSEIVALTAVANQRSIALMERLGMNTVRHCFNHPALPTHSPLSQHCLYRRYPPQPAQSPAISTQRPGYQPIGHRPDATTFSTNQHRRVRGAGQSSAADRQAQCRWD